MAHLLPHGPRPARPPRGGPRRRHGLRTAPVRQPDHGRAGRPGGAGHAAARPLVEGPRSPPRRRRRAARVAGRGRAGDRRLGHRPVPGARPDPPPAAVRRDGDVVRPMGQRRAPDDGGLRVHPDQHRQRPRPGHDRPALAARPPHRPGAGRRLRQLPDREHRSTRIAVWNAIDPTRTRPALAVGIARGRLARVRPRGVADAPPRRPRPLPTDGRGAQLRRLGGAGDRGPPSDVRRPHLPLHHPVPHGAAAGLAGAALARRAARRPGGDGHRGDRRGPVRRGGRRPGRPGVRLRRRRVDRRRRAGPRARRAGDGRGHDAPGRGGGPRWQRRHGPLRGGRRRCRRALAGRGRCPADDLEDRLRRGAGIIDLADPPGEVHAWR